MSGALEAGLRPGVRPGARVVPYVTGGFGRWERIVEAIADAGADAIEVGIPFSDPVMDGPVIQEASQRALDGGATPVSIVDRLADVDVPVPMAVMTYYNLVYRFGLERFAAELGVGRCGRCHPARPPARRGRPVAGRGRPGRCRTGPAGRSDVASGPSGGDLRAVAGVRRTGWAFGRDGRESGSGGHGQGGRGAAKAMTDTPVLVGVGVSTPDQAVEICEVADGVVVGSAIVRRILEGAEPADVAALVKEFRTALDARWPAK